MSEHMSPIPSRVYNAAVGGHVCGPEDVDFGQKVVHLVKYDKSGNEVSFESQVTQSNKIYVIHDDFTLSSNITIPANCVLEFDGGSLSGAYTITGQDTGIRAGLVEILKNDIIISGSWNVNKAYSKWFDFDVTGNTDDSSKFESLLLLSSNIEVSNGDYSIEHVELPNNINIEGKGSVRFVARAINNEYTMCHKSIFIGNNINTVTFKHISFIGRGYFTTYDASNAPVSEALIIIDTASSLTIEDCSFSYALSGRNNYDNISGMIIDCNDCSNVIIKNSVFYKLAGIELINIGYTEKDRDSITVIFSNNDAHQMNNGGTMGYTLLNAICGQLFIENNKIYKYNYRGDLFNCQGNYTYCNNNVISSDSELYLGGVFDNSEFGEYSGEYFEIIGNVINCNGARAIKSRARKVVVRDNDFKCLSAFMHADANGLIEGTTETDSITIENNTFDLTHTADGYTPMISNYLDGICLMSYGGRKYKKVSILNNNIYFKKLGYSRHTFLFCGLEELYLINNNIVTDDKDSNSNYNILISFYKENYDADNIDINDIIIKNNIYKTWNGDDIILIETNISTFNNASSYPIFIQNVYLSSSQASFSFFNPNIAIRELHSDNCGLHELCNIRKVFSKTKVDYKALYVPNSQTTNSVIDKINVRINSDNNPNKANSVYLDEINGQYITIGTKVVFRGTNEGGMNNRLASPLSNVTINNTDIQNFPYRTTEGFILYSGVYWYLYTAIANRNYVSKITIDGIITKAEKSQVDNVLSIGNDYNGSHLIISDDNYKHIYRVNNSWVYEDGTTVPY